MPVTVTLLNAIASPAIFRPGASVQLRITWSLPDLPADRIARLIYRTAGKGTTDVVSVAEVSDPLPPREGTWDVTLTLPIDAPPSYDGRLISISWFAQAQLGKKNVGEAPMIVSPDGRPIVPQLINK